MSNHKQTEYKMSNKRTDEDPVKKVKELKQRINELESRNKQLSDERNPYKAIMKDLKGGYYQTDLQGNIGMLSKSLSNILGYDQGQLIGKKITYLYENPAERDAFLQKLKDKSNIKNYEVNLKHKNGKTLTVLKNSHYIHDEQGKPIGIEGIMNDVTFLKNSGSRRNIIIDLLDVFNNKGDLHKIFKKVTKLMQRWSGCDAVGIRLEEDEDYPYFGTRGFPAEFVKLENKLCAVDQENEKIRDSEGNPVLECMCGNVIYGRYDPELPFFTENGSFWTNSTSKLLASTSEEDRQARTRNRCNGEGYESVALIPLRFRNKVLGLLQFNDKNPDQFNIRMIKKLENFASGLAMAIAERQNMQALIESEQKFHTLFDNLKDAVIVHKFNLSDNKPGPIQMANQAALELVGYDKEELTSMSPWKIESDRVRNKYLKDILAEIQEKGNAIFESEIIPKNGQRLAIEVNANLCKLNGEDFLISIIRDITDRKSLEKELRENKDKYQALYDNAPLPYHSLNRAGRIIDVNPKWLTTLGYLRKEVIGKSFTDFLHPDYLDKFNKMYHKFKQEGEIHEVHYKIKHKDGHYIDTSFDGYASYDYQGNMKRTYCVFKDITEQKRLQKSLDQVEDRYRNLIHASTNHMFMLTLDGYYMLSNDKVHQFGLEKGSQLVGRHVLEVHDLETGHFYQNKIEEVVQTKQPVSFEHTLHSTDRQHYHIDTLYPMHKDGQIWAIGGICRDITDSKRSEIKLRESKQRYKDLVEKAGTAILVDDAEGNFEYFNKQFAELFGYSTQEIKNQSLSSLIHPDDLDEVNQIHKDRLQGKDVPSRYEYRGIKKDGSAIYIEVDAVELKEDDKIVGTRSYLWDITDRKKAELQLRQTMKYLSKLEENFRQQAAQKLHDHVGQNLTALTFNLDYIYNQLPKNSNKNVKKRFDDSLDLLNDTIQSIRNIISEMRPSVLEDYGLFAAINWYAEKYSERTSIQTRVNGSELEDRLPEEIESSIFRIVQELFNNAAKYSRADKIMVNFQEEDDKITIAVRDDGIGFKIDDIKNSDGPTGMGILSMEDRVSALGGKFELKSAPGQGTKIKIILEK